MFFFFKQKSAYEMRISDWSSDVCSSDLIICLSATAAHPSTSMPSSARLIGPFTLTGHLDGRRRVWLDCKVSFWMWRPVWQVNYRKEILLKRQSEDCGLPLEDTHFIPGMRSTKNHPKQALGGQGSGRRSPPRGRRD